MRANVKRTTDEAAACDVCGAWVPRSVRADPAEHDRELHRVVALERIADALESLAAVQEKPHG